MRKALLITTVLALAAPAGAAAKTGIEVQRYPETSKGRTVIPFTVHVFREPPASGGRAMPITGIHPLVTFRSKSGRVVRVRTHRTDGAGAGRASVRFPDKGPWLATFHLKTHGVYVGTESSEPIHVGIGLTQTIPSADQTRKAAPAPDFPWLWVLSLASIGSAVLVLAMRRRGHWGAA